MKRELLSSSKNREIKELYERYGYIIMRRCKMILKSEDEAYDATQEIFIKLIESIDKIHNKGSIYSWLLSTTTNHCISILRKKRGESFEENIHLKEEDNILPQEKGIFINEIINLFLPPWDKKTRQILFYTYIYGYNQQEIAELTGMGESTIRRYLNRFRSKVASMSHKKEEVV